MVEGNGVWACNTTLIVWDSGEGECLMMDSRFRFHGGVFFLGMTAEYWRGSVEIRKERVAFGNATRPFL